jgi:alkyl hydroperoxide reductase subunit F
MYELVIIGGGPAGMTATVYAARKRLNTLLVAKDLGGQVNWTAGIENYMGYQFIEGPELTQKFEDQVKQFPVDMKTSETVEDIFAVDGGFKIKTDEAQYEAKSVIIASGKRPRPLNVPGEERLVGRGVTYCAVCDGPLFTGQKVVVVGGGNSALEAIDDMLKIAEHVNVVSTTPFTGDSVLIEKIKGAPNLTAFMEFEVDEIFGENRVSSVKIHDMHSPEVKELEVGGIFIEIGLIPNSGFATSVVKLNPSGEIEVNCANETGVPGLFAAGDVTNVPEKQIVVAAGEGAKAALQAHRYLQRLGT